ncbi:YheC/YheD family protein [Metabacillus rhizolycopersici]|uniref:YheC/YheD family protein n=1 Tax=Metabacillus rhizolycopersici TaxID=2875709 RepID=A0ABS7UVI1_9BACI|nr:YheC/YheD family protein [Metabacillus rhizolycopersici]MBZ5751960.1 YheC/YheD family protein [Metabacillus rhizolycopersici]
MSYEGVGVLVPSAVYKQIPQLSGNLKSMFLLFEQAAEKNKLIPCYIKLSKLRPSKRSVVAYVKTTNGYQLMRVPRPSIIYSRIIDISQAVRKRIRSLSQEGVTLFNIPNYDVEKYKIHQLLLKDEIISKHLPQTEVLTKQNLRKMMTEYDSLILKQNYGERGIGAMKLEQRNDFWTLTYKTPKMINFKRLHFSNILPNILEDHIENGHYIIQERIKLATYNGAPFDMRVAVQKDGEGKFKVTGIMCKVAKKNHFLTNGSEGGQTYRLDDIHSQAIPKIPLHVLQKTISIFTIRVAHHLEQYFPHLADLGFDICLTKEGTPYFIECNFISDYVGGLFQHQKLIHDEWSKVFTTPFDYARYLMNQKKTRKEE